MAKKKSVVKRRNPTYSHQEKLNAVQVYYIEGTSRKAAAITGIDHTTICAWLREDAACQNFMQQLRDDNEDLFRSKTTKIVQNGLDQLSDRINNGNVKVERIDSKDEEGNAIRESVEFREPLTSKDLVYATGVMTDKLRVSLNLPTKITDNSSTENKMREEFKKLTQELRGMQEQKVEESIPPG